MIEINQRNAYEILHSLIGDNKYLEIALRDKKKKFESFIKLVIESPTDNKDLIDNIASKMLSAAKSIDNNSIKTFQSLNSIKSLNHFSIAINSLNLCANVYGFEIINNRLNYINKNIDEVKYIIEKTHNIQINHEFNKVVSEHMNMLDCKRINKEYCQEQYRKLVDDEKNTLSLLYESFMEVSSNKSDILYAILSLSSMLACTISYYDELYYFENKDFIKDGEFCHGSHSEWLNIYEKLHANEFKSVLQDYAFIEMKLNQYQTDLFVHSIDEAFLESRRVINDQQQIITLLGEKDKYNDYKKIINELTMKEMNSYASLLNDEEYEIIKPVMCKAKASLDF